MFVTGTVLKDDNNQGESDGSLCDTIS